MIILPVEKQFDWANPPLVLLVLVFLDVFAYVFYQANDDAIVGAVVTAYVEQGFYAVELDKYEAYLAGEQGPEAVAALRATQRSDGDFAVAWQMLRDEAFEPYLAWNWDWALAPELGEDWRERRGAMTDALGRVSVLRFGLVPADLGPGSVLTYQFLHADFMHLVGNMFFLVMCGFAVEAALGHLRFLAFYLVSGAVAGLAHALLDLEDTTPLVGASGSISGVMAMYLTLFRLRRIEFFYWVFLFVGYLRLPALAVLPLYIGKELWFLLSATESNVAFLAHAAGFATGTALVGLVLVFRPRAIDEDYIEQDQSVDPARAALAEVYEAIGEYRFEAARAKLAALQEQYGDDFAYRRLAWQLHAADRSDGLAAATDALVSYRDAAPAEIREQARAIAREPEVLGRLPDDALMRLGARLGRIEEIGTVERILAALVERGVSDDRIGVMARRLAGVFRDRQNSERFRHYTAMADRYL